VLGTKGPLLEEIVRAYFAKQGFFALRSLPLRYEGEDVTDVDIWLYARQSASVRTRAIVDVKNKKSPRALEPVLWTKGLQTVTNADRAIVVTTDNSPHIVKFGQKHKVIVLTNAFLDRLLKTLPLQDRLSLEELLDAIRKYSGQKADGDWIRRLEDTKSGLISLSAFPALNRSLASFGFFVNRIESRPHFAEQALRCALLCASVACITLDAALERVVFEDTPGRQKAILDGVTYGDSGDSRTQKGIDNVLALLEENMENGKVIANEAKRAITASFQGVRADILAEHFSREHNSSQLVPIARELESLAHQRHAPATATLSPDARALMGVFADFVQAKRQVILGATFAKAAPTPPVEDAEQSPQKAEPGKLL